MIPRFPPTRGVRECATPTTPGRSGRWRASPQRSSPTHTTSNPGNHHTRNTHQHSPCLRRHDIPHWTDLDAEYDRSRHGLRPISAEGRLGLGVWEVTRSDSVDAQRWTTQHTGPCPQEWNGVWLQRSVFPTCGQRCGKLHRCFSTCVRTAVDESHHCASPDSQP